MEQETCVAETSSCRSCEVVIVDEWDVYSIVLTDRFLCCCLFSLLFQVASASHLTSLGDFELPPPEK
jgi:hypothetical protein